MQRVNRRGSHVLSENCKIRYSSTLAKTHVHNFKSSENKGLASPRDLCGELNAEDHRYFLNVVK